MAALVLAMVVVGGATRLTGSGLSITEWKPISGAIPPLNDAAWQVEFHNYQRIPQYQYVNKGMSLAAFKGIYWWEWAHRLLGRLLGVVFAVPFVVFLAMRRLPRRLMWRCAVLFLLGGLQGFVGWWMVKSGLEGRVSVAPERLAIHLGLALILYCALIWTGWEAWAGASRPSYPSRLRAPTLALAALVYVQCLLGALVAGNKAGLVDNDWPLMNGRLFPTDYRTGGPWRTLLHSQAAVQFNHRLVAYALIAAAIGLAFAALRGRHLSPVTRGLAAGLALAVAAQATLGIATLIMRAPLDLSALHQLGAALVLAIAVTLAWRARRA
jgi:cytochrome c oxidase assembly protein subunit 15